MTDIIDADREAAKKFIRWWRRFGHDQWTDGVKLTEVFARHRIAHQPKLTADMLKEAMVGRIGVCMFKLADDPEIRFDPDSSADRLNALLQLATGEEEDTRRLDWLLKNYADCLPSETTRYMIDRAMREEASA